MRLDDKIVLVTGASNGIGRALALGVAAEGAHVIVNYCTDEKSAESVAKDIRALGREAMTVQADIAKISHIRRMFRRVRGKFKRLDVLVNNAGITGWTALFDTTEGQWDRVLDTNLKVC